MQTVFQDKIYNAIATSHLSRMEYLQPLMESQGLYKFSMLFECITLSSDVIKDVLQKDVKFVERVIIGMHAVAKETRVAHSADIWEGDLDRIMESGISLEAKRAFMHTAFMTRDLPISFAKNSRWQIWIYEIGRLWRLRSALTPYVWAIKGIVSVTLDAPATGSRFVRDHGCVLNALLRDNV